MQALGDRHPMARPPRPGWWEADVRPTRPPGPTTRSGWTAATAAARPAFPAAAVRPAGAEPHATTTPPSAGRDRGWRGTPLRGSVIYELHVGTFTPEGTFDAAIERLDHLRDLGVTMVELMPVAAFPGRTAGATTGSTCGRCTSPTAARTG